MLASPRYLRATLITAAAVAVLPSLMLGIALLDFFSPDSNSSGDSGFAQGLFISSVAAALAISFVATAFPSAAYFLQLRGCYSATNFFWLLVISLAIFASAATILASQVLGGSLREFAVLWAMLFLMAAVLTLPFSWLWARLAQLRPNNSFKPKPLRGSA